MSYPLDTVGFIFSQPNILAQYILDWNSIPPTLLTYQLPVFPIETHGSAGASGSPFCKNSMEIASGERTNAMCPSRGGRLISTKAGRDMLSRP